MLHSWGYTSKNLFNRLGLEGRELLACAIRIIAFQRSNLMGKQSTEEQHLLISYGHQIPQMLAL